ncbi:unnamed protein product [Adineta steineri]|uniref:Transglutaminase-like domain-containing protein n=1 Tax=Adineta steineri TaxID=433720 RepID=A0A815JEN9_9BILA|nr:unnamed protein product [Adineta steineri]CAF3584750.1 unnamed protein product [Adineta steineri]
MSRQQHYYDRSNVGQIEHTRKKSVNGLMPSFVPTILGNIQLFLWMAIIGLEVVSIYYDPGRGTVYAGIWCSSVFFVTWIAMFCYLCCGRSAGCGIYLVIQNSINLVFAIILVIFTARFVKDPCLCYGALCHIPNWNQIFDFDSFYGNFIYPCTSRTFEKLPILKILLACAALMLVSNIIFIIVYIIFLVKSRMDKSSNTEQLNAGFPQESEAIEVGGQPSNHPPSVAYPLRSQPQPQLHPQPHPHPNPNPQPHPPPQAADSQAFNKLFIRKRQQAVNNTSYRKTIESWKPNSLQQLVQMIKSLSNGKSIIDQHWIIFYWIAHSIEYDTVALFTKNYADQSAEGVFRTKKGVCAGYGNIYKYLCDQLQMPCERVSGYSKGYGFDDREGAPTETDHAWNAVEIDGHWYLIESTWGAGKLNDNKAFERQLDSYYFLPRPNEMIYHHLPEDEKWQLLERRIQMDEYMQMPKLRPLYFELNLELINPYNQAHVDLVPGKPYALVLIRAPSDVQLIARLELNGKKIEGGHRVIFNREKQIYRCYFAPANIGKHKITIFGKRDDSESSKYSSAVELIMNVKKIPVPHISYPHTWPSFDDLGLKVIAPKDRANAVWNDNGSYAEILIKAPDDVQLSCDIQYNNIKIKNGSLAQFNNDKRLWQLLFAPEHTGQHELIVYGKRTSDTESSSTSVVKFNLNVTKLRRPMKFPTTYGQFEIRKCQIYTPLEGILKKGSVVPIHCIIPNALDVRVDVDSKRIGNEGYTNQILQKEVTVGSREITIYAKYEEGSNYTGLVKYTVE